MSWKQKLVDFYNIPFVHGLVAVIEGAAAGALSDALIEPRELLTKHGLLHLGVAMLTGVGLALRNYLKNNRAAAIALAEQKFFLAPPLNAPTGTTSPTVPPTS